MVSITVPATAIFTQGIKNVTINIKKLVYSSPHKITFLFMKEVKTYTGYSGYIIRICDILVCRILLKSAIKLDTTKPDMS